jgi:hypothetical protein
VPAFADFYSQIPPENAVVLAPLDSLAFAQNGPSSGSDIVRSTGNSFMFATGGTYLVTFGASVTEAAQMALSLDGAVIPSSVVGRATGTSVINGTTLVTAQAGAILDVVNASAGAMTLTPFAGGPNAASAHLTILRLL